jgi:hypothetical protein
LRAARRNIPGIVEPDGVDVAVVIVVAEDGDALLARRQVRGQEDIAADVGQADGVADRGAVR